MVKGEQRIEVYPFIDLRTPKEEESQFIMVIKDEIWCCDGGIHIVVIMARFIIIAGDGEEGSI